MHQGEPREELVGDRRRGPVPAAGVLRRRAGAGARLVRRAPVRRAGKRDRHVAADAGVRGPGGLFSNVAARESGIADRGDG
ncbi:MAG: hypothetical protein WDM92_13820 [Caulobacteraceae bacterium]